MVTDQRYDTNLIDILSGWRQCMRHGQGNDQFANGDMYLGEYAYGRAEGYGMYKWINGHTYSGIFKYLVRISKYLMILKIR